MRPRDECVRARTVRDAAATEAGGTTPMLDLADDEAEGASGSAAEPSLHEWPAPLLTYIELLRATNTSGPEFVPLSLSALTELMSATRCCYHDDATPKNNEDQQEAVQAPPAR